MAKHLSKSKRTLPGHKWYHSLVRQDGYIDKDTEEYVLTCGWGDCTQEIARAPRDAERCPIDSSPFCSADQHH